MIKSITISGFRGIRSPLTLDFEKGKSVRSLIIYGRNGTGKSSITDAWEWIHTGKIRHLAREGAKENAYPHIQASAGETYVEIGFDSNEIDLIRSEYDHSRITIPSDSDNINDFRELVLHPCHIRFEDLSRFVYLSKTEKYDALAEFMGFVPQVEIQKSLKRVLTNLKNELSEFQTNEEILKKQLEKLLSVESFNEDSFLEKLNNLTDEHQVEGISSITDLESLKYDFNQLVTNDPRAQELANLDQLKRILNKIEINSSIVTRLSDYFDSIAEFKKQEKFTTEILLLDLYEQGHAVIQELETETEVEICPLCNQPFEGNLKQHISSQLSKLKSLKAQREKLENDRAKIKGEMPTKMLLQIVNELQQEPTENLLELYSVNNLNLIEYYEQIASLTSEIEKLLEKKPESVVILNQDNLQNTLDSISKKTKQAIVAQSKTIAKIDNRMEALKSDATRTQLVEANSLINQAVNLWHQYEEAVNTRNELEIVYNSYDAIVGDYIQSSIENVQTRLALISSDVETYFSILEEATAGLGHPELRLLTDEDRAIELQVEFRGQTIYPAYKYLSESQLNSFGLAIFLASAKYFNKDFKFLILDDVINSFDGYKRPQVIKLLKQECPDHQILIMTHDSMWFDRLTEEFPSWNRLRFIRLTPGKGPVTEEGQTPLEEIIELVKRDKPSNAGSLMGPFLERQLKQLGAAFEMMVKYNLRNEYTLDPLLDRFRVRVRDKLGKDHKLCKAIEDLQREQGFRNICAHWKQLEIPITLEEMQAVIDKWKIIESMVRCSTCHIFLEYDGNSLFVCPKCRNEKLEKS